MKTAILYQNAEPPAEGGIRKPMKPGGYSDSGADIAFCLRNAGEEIITPVCNPNIYSDKDWVFPDTEEGIRSAIDMGAEVLWLNTVLYRGHPIEKFKGVYFIGQRVSDTVMFDDKYYINNLLRQRGFPTVKGEIVDAAFKYSGKYPCVIKPIRGRGSQGVIKCSSPEEADAAINADIKAEVYGTRFIAEEFLAGKEITISVMPKGKSLPVVERFNHENGIAPYNGKVPVIENSRVITDNTPEIDEIVHYCEKAVREFDLKGLCRIDCRADDSGKYKIFDFNLKPNMTGAARPHRQNQNSLTMIAAEAMGLSYSDLLRAMHDTHWTE